MANSKISALTSATTPLAGTETLPIVQSSTTKQVSVANLTAGRDTTIANLVAYNPGFGYFGIRNSSLAAAFSNNALGQSSDGLNTILNAAAGGTVKLRINDTSVVEVATDTTIKTGNVVQGTAAKGFNFTANTPAAGMTSQLLNWYEEGTWTPTQGAGLVVVGTFSSSGRYTRIGRQVTVSARLTGSTSIACTAGGVFTTGLPYAPNSVAAGAATSSNLAGTILYVDTTIYSVSAMGAAGALSMTATYSV
jgi:hypothetical protein